MPKGVKIHKLVVRLEAEGSRDWYAALWDGSRKRMGCDG